MFIWSTRLFSTKEYMCSVNQKSLPPAISDLWFLIHFFNVFRGPGRSIIRNEPRQSLPDCKREKFLGEKGVASSWVCHAPKERSSIFLLRNCFEKYSNQSSVQERVFRFTSATKNFSQFKHSINMQILLLPSTKTKAKTERIWQKSHRYL